MDAGRRKNHRDLILWQKAMSLATDVHRLTNSLPKHEVFGLASQLQLSRNIGYVSDTSLTPVLARLDEVGRLLNAVISGLRRREARR